MGRGQSEHHVPLGLRQSEQQAREIGRYGLAECAEESYQQHNPPHARSFQQRAQIDKHAHANQKIGNEDGIADELNAVHQRRHLGNVAVQNQAGEEGSEDALQSDEG